MLLVSWVRTKSSFERDLEGLDGANGEIGRDVGEALARHMKQDVVECTSRQARGLRVKIEHGGPERWSVGRWNKLVVEPQTIVANRHRLDRHRDQQRGNVRDLRDRISQPLEDSTRVMANEPVWRKNDGIDEFSFRWRCFTGASSSDTRGAEADC